MSKDTHLVNIYLKIHNKRPLTMLDLKYLAKYDPECFEKTCKNVVYNVPETKPVMEPIMKPAMAENPNHVIKAEDLKRKSIQQILDNIKSLEVSELPMADVDADKVKTLLGSLYMEMLFPHNDKEAFINMPTTDKPSFDKKV